MEENITAAESDEVLVQPEIAEESIPPKKKRKPINQQKLQDNIWGWTFCVPLLVGTILFVYIALVIALLLSFTNYNTNSGSVWEFLGKLFSSDFKKVSTFEGAYDPFYWYRLAFTKETYSCQNMLGEEIAINEMGAYLFNTVFYMIGIPIGMVLSVFFAVCMSRDIKGGNVFRVLYYIPCVASTISIVYTFRIMFKADGVINQILCGTGADTVKIPWIDINESELRFGNGDPFWRQGLLNKLVIIIMSVWKGLGGTIILYVAGLSGVNAATKEAAQIDGASGWTIFWKVTMPDLYPTIFYNIVTSVIGGMQIYAEPELFFPLSATGPNVMTSGYVSLIWYYGINGKSGSSSVDTSQGAAYGMILAIIILVLTLFQFWLDSRKKD
ncbi:MAG: sugar ABC transporter permease [Clostridiales bacterium]|nr:sugar ABC transporter permease [Clostridiales bacterium]